MSRPKLSILSILLLIPSAIVLSLHGYLGSFTRFISDDFCSSYLANRFGMFRYIWFWFLNFGGRFSAIAADWFIVPIGPDGVRFVPPIILFLWLVITTVATFSLLRTFAGEQNILVSLSLSSFLLFVTLLISPNVEQSLYWWNGMRTYILPILVFTFTIIIFVWMQEKWTSPKNIWFGSLVSFILALGCGGFNETFTTVQFTLIALILFISLISKKIHFSSPSFLFLMAAMLGTVTALTIMFIVPGRANRQSYFTPTQDLISAFIIALWSFITYLRELTGSAAKIAGILALFLGTILIGMEAKNSQQNTPWLSILALLSGFILVLVSFFPAAYSMSEAPPTRTQIIPSFFMMICLMLSGYAGGHWLKSRIIIPSVPHLLLIAFVLCLSFFSAWVNATSLYSKRSIYSDYAKKWDAMNLQILQAKDSGKESITISRLNNWAGLEEPSDNPKYWVTVCYSAYYDFPVLGPPLE